MAVSDKVNDETSARPEFKLSSENEGNEMKESSLAFCNWLNWIACNWVKASNDKEPVMLPKPEKSTAVMELELKMWMSPLTV